MADLATLAMLAIGLAAAGFLAHRLRMPPALGYVVAGVMFAAWAPSLVPSGLPELAQLGILVLLFLIGIELDLKRLIQSLRGVAGTLPFDVAVPALVGVAFARWIGWTAAEAAALGIVIAIGSDIFGERLASLPGVDSRTKQRAMGVLISQDVIAGGLIALLVVLGSGTGALGTPFIEVGRTLFLLVVMSGIAVMVVPRLLDEVARRHVPELLVLWSAGILVVLAYVGGLAGARELGALVAGVAAAEAGSRYVARNALAGVRDLAAAVFFFSAGAAVPLPAVLAHAPAALAVAGVVLVANLVVHVPASLASGVPLRGSVQVAAALIPLGEFNLILAGIADREGLAHEALLPVVVGAMLVLLPAATLLSKGAGFVHQAYHRTPRRFRAPLETLAHAVRRKPSAKQRGSAWRRHLRRVLVDGILVVALAALALWLRPYIPGIPGGPAWSAGALWLGLTAAFALPLLYALYGAYRDLVWAMVGLQPGERVGAGKVRARLVDAGVAGSAVLVLAFISLWIPRALPVLAGGAVIAGAIAAVAWRRLSRFHNTLAHALGRVLGDDAETARFLDQVMEKYPWGVRFAAVSIPPGSPVAGRTLKDSRLGAFTGATVAVIQRGRQETVNPGPDVELLPGDHLVLLGDQEQLGRAEALIVAHGDAVRLTAQSLAAEVLEVVVQEGSPWLGKPLGALNIREETGTLVIGLWPPGSDHPLPFKPDSVLAVGTRLILLGTPLQLQRAQIRAAGVGTA